MVAGASNADCFVFSVRILHVPGMKFTARSRAMSSGTHLDAWSVCSEFWYSEPFRSRGDETIFALWAFGGNAERWHKRGRPMSAQSATGTDRADGMGSLEARRRARVVASLAEYLAEHVRGHPHRERAAMAALAEWCEGDRELLAQARADVLQDTRRAQRHARNVLTGVAQNNQEAVELLEMAASTS
jgi:hypothetical protein